MLKPAARPVSIATAASHRPGGFGLEKLIAVSTRGCPGGDRIGDLKVLWELEQGLRRQPSPAAIQRGAYYLRDNPRFSGKS